MNDTQKRIAGALSIAVALAIPAEGLRQYAYDDTGGILTVCRGHTGADIHKGAFYSLEQCDEFMNEDMRKAVLIVERCVPGLPATVLGAFADIVYNEGPTVACSPSKSHAARYLASHQLDLACKELPKWNRARVGNSLIVLPGLTKRRNAEMQQCLEGIS